MTAFSRILTKQKAIDTKIRRAHTMAKSRCNTDFNDKHAGECRDAQQNNFKVLDKRVKEETEKKQLRNETFRSKLHLVE